MDMNRSFRVKVCRQDAEAQFRKELLSGVRINGFELLYSLVYFSVYVAVFEVDDGGTQVVHMFSVLEWMEGKKQGRDVMQTGILGW